MNFKEKIKYFWNVILGPDYTEPVIETILDNTAAIEEKYEKSFSGQKSTSSTKAGKGNKVVEIIEVDDSKARKVAEQKQKEKSTEEPKTR